MKDLMAKVKGLVQDRASKKDHQHAAACSEQDTKKVDWEMNSDDALRAPIVSGYK